jgi:acetolactate synthase-1/2/3 large subunit
MLAPNLEKIAESYGMKYFKAKTIGEAKKIMKQAKKVKGSVLCECIVESEENVFPMVPSGKSLNDTLIG